MITRELAFPLIEETVGRKNLGGGWDTLISNTTFAPATLKEVTDPTGGAFTWTEDAVARLNRVPAGFMRDMTREAIEKVAREKEVGIIDLEVCEEGIGHARQTMNEVIAGYVRNKPTA